MAVESIQADNEKPNFRQKSLRFAKERIKKSPENLRNFVTSYYWVGSAALVAYAMLTFGAPIWVTGLVLGGVVTFHDTLINIGEMFMKPFKNTLRGNSKPNQQPQQSQQAPEGGPQ